MTSLVFVPSIAVSYNSNAWSSMPETEVVGSCAMAARSALIIGPTVLWRHRSSAREAGNTNDDNRHYDDDNPEREARQASAFRPSRTRSSKSFIHPRGKVHSRGHVCRADRHCKRGIYALSATQLSQGSPFYVFPSHCINSIREDKNSETERNCFNQ